MRGPPAVETMNDGSQFIDIILFAMVAVFLGLRLRSVLGRRTGTEQPPVNRFTAAPPPPVKPDNVVELPRRPQGPPPVSGSGVEAICAADPSFSPEGFTQGARGAFELIIRAFAEGDEARLQPLLAPAVFEPFSAAIRARRAAGQVCANQLVKIDAAEIAEAALDNAIARVDVRFVSQQIILTKDSEGRIVDGDPSRVVSLIDLWSFARDTRTRDPNWQLVATRSLDA
jgi:predicted lipid-binding transport protein (Tim44 family)